MFGAVVYGLVEYSPCLTYLREFWANTLTKRKDLYDPYTSIGAKAKAKGSTFEIALGPFDFRGKNIPP
jgi:hypothetical protein